MVYYFCSFWSYNQYGTNIYMKSVKHSFVNVSLMVNGGSSSWALIVFSKVFWGHNTQSSSGTHGAWGPGINNPVSTIKSHHFVPLASDEDLYTVIESQGEKGRGVSLGVMNRPPSSFLLSSLLFLQRVLCSPSLYMTLHFPFSLSARFCFPDRLPSMLRLMSLFFSRASSSWNSSFTLEFVLADVSMKAHFQAVAWASPSFVSTSRCAISSLLLPTSMMGMDSVLPLIARTWKDMVHHVSLLRVWLQVTVLISFSKASCNVEFLKALFSGLFYLTATCSHNLRSQKATKYFTIFLQKRYRFTEHYHKETVIPSKHRVSTTITDWTWQS